jgi:hypothetical protein
VDAGVAWGSAAAAAARKTGQIVAGTDRQRPDLVRGTDSAAPRRLRRVGCAASTGRRQPPGVGSVINSPMWMSDGFVICGFSLRTVAYGTLKNFAMPPRLSPFAILYR